MQNNYNEEKEIGDHGWLESLGEKAGQTLGNKLLKEMADGHSSALFIAVLLATITDFSDFLLLGQIPIIGTIIKLIAGTAITLILWDIGGFIKVKVRILLWVVAPPIELIPFLATIPTYSIAIIWAYFKIKKRGEEAREKIQKILAQQSPEEYYDELEQAYREINQRAARRIRKIQTKAGISIDDNIKVKTKLGLQPLTVNTKQKPEITHS